MINIAQTQPFNPHRFYKAMAFFYDPYQAVMVREEHEMSYKFNQMTFEVQQLKFWYTSGKKLSVKGVPLFVIWMSLTLPRGACIIIKKKNTSKVISRSNKTLRDENVSLFRNKNSETKSTKGS